MNRNTIRYKPQKVLFNYSGMTLVEMLVYMVIAGMLLAMAVTAFLGQNKSYNRQELVAEIQQNIRGATEQMASDIRFAGLGLIESPTYKAFGLAENSQLTINQWPDSGYFSGTPGIADDQISVHYRLTGSDLGRADTGIGIGITADTLGDGYFRTIAENIDDLRFEYQLESDDYFRWVGNVDSEDYEDIKAVKIMILGSARPSAFNRTDSATYNFPLDEPGETHIYTPIAGTGYKRLMSIVVQARNTRN